MITNITDVRYDPIGDYYYRILTIDINGEITELEIIVPHDEERGI